jgi:hypothetical protein
VTDRNGESSGAIAAVVSRSSTHQTLKLKGTDARVLEAERTGLPLTGEYPEP